MNITNSRKRILTLIAVIILATCTQAFADTAEEETKQLVSNRYTFVTEKGTEKLMSTTTYTKEQLNTQAKIRDAVLSITSYVDDTPLGYVDDLSKIFFEVHQTGKAARVKAYIRLDTKYRIDSVTGKKTSAGSRYVYTYKFYTQSADGSYKHYKTHSFSQANFR